MPVTLHGHVWWTVMRYLYAVMRWGSTVSKQIDLGLVHALRTR